MSAELEQLRKEYAKFRASLTRVENPLERVGRMKEELGGLEASVTSPSGKVTVVAGPGGSIKDIVLAEDAVQIPAGALAAELKSTVTQAVANAARQQAAIVDEHMGGGHAAYEQVLQNQADALGTTVDQLKASMGASEPAPARPTRNEDDFSENTLMSKEHETPPPAAPPAESSSGSAGDQFLKNLFNEDE